jgi:hypothetical protein
MDELTYDELKQQLLLCGAVAARAIVEGAIYKKALEEIIFSSSPGHEFDTANYALIKANEFLQRQQVAHGTEKS